jgi:hypothetical protein
MIKLVGIAMLLWGGMRLIVDTSSIWGAPLVVGGFVLLLV